MRGISQGKFGKWKIPSDGHLAIYLLFYVLITVLNSVGRRRDELSLHCVAYVMGCILSLRA